MTYEEYIEKRVNLILHKFSGYSSETAHNLARQQVEYEYEFTHGGFSPRSLIGAEPWPSEAVVKKFRRRNRK